MLVEEFKEDCTLLEKTRTPDGEGGWSTEWREGIRFRAAVVVDSTLQARVAEKAGMMSIYTVTTDRNQKLDFHDVFRRNRDGRVFRVTSDSSDRATPDVATFQFHQVSAEEWSLA